VRVGPRQQLCNDAVMTYALDKAPSPYDVLPKVPSFSLTSEGITDGERMPEEHVSRGDNRSPQLSWSGAPAETRGYAISVYDPDAPTGSGFWHWFVLGIPASVTSVARGELPDGAYCMRNDFGNYSYDGPEPPPGHGTHRYYVAVHALDSDDLGVSAEKPTAQAGFNVTLHTLARAVLMVTYHQ
jgi:Raf kinase inhibitor-like YbhB/YbcL family protein